MKVITIDWSIVDYAKAWEMQTNIFNGIIDAKQGNISYQNTIIMCEHPHVYTLGRNGKSQNILISDEQLKRINATLYHIDRGGDITYHGPGQLVCYPILDLEDFSLALKKYVNLLEEAVIRVCALYNINAGRIDSATGVWIDGTSNRARKICAIGVRCSKFVSMHGLALNVNTDMQYFNYINPCGFVDKGVTSIAQELGHEVSIDKVKQQLDKEIRNLLLKR